MASVEPLVPRKQVSFAVFERKEDCMHENAVGVKAAIKNISDELPSQETAVLAQLFQKICDSFVYWPM